jgi:hypothetical protein
MKFFLQKHCMTALCCLFIGSLGSVHGTQASWINNVDTNPNWDGTANWKTNPASTFPQFPGDAASIVAIPNPGNTIFLSTSGTNISLGALYTNVNNLIIDFTTVPGTLTFNSGGTGTASLFAGQSLTVEAPVVLTSALDIYVSSGSAVTFMEGISGGISGGNSITIVAVSPEGNVFFNATNSYVGSTTVEGGGLSLNGPNGTTVIPGDLIVVGSRSSVFGFVNNQFASTSNVFLNEQGSFDFNGTLQTFNSLSVGNGSSIVDTTFAQTGAVILNDPTTAITITANGMVSIPNITLENGGGIVYNSNVLPGSGEGFLETGNLGAFIIDLNGKSTFLTNNGINNSPADLTIENAVIQNGGLTIAGPGTTLFTGHLGSFPADAITFGCIINDGFAIIGATGSSPPDVMGTTGTVEVTASGVLLGFATLGTSGQGAVSNLATVEPGNIDVPGTLTISGSYSQSSIGTLLIQAESTSNFSNLVVEGAVSLDGTLLFQALEKNTVSLGNTYVIITSTVPITGRFSNVDANLPADLGVNVIYNTNDVVVQIISTAGGVCPICPSFSLLPPSDLTATLVKDKDMKKNKFVRLDFYPSPSLNVKEYNVYRNDEFIGRVENLFKFDDHRKIKKNTEYAVTSVSTTGAESTPAEP